MSWGHDGGQGSRGSLGRGGSWGHSRGHSGERGWMARGKGRGKLTHDKGPLLRARDTQKE